MNEPTVPNRQPRIPPGVHRLAVIGDYPSQEDLITREPFTGNAGRLIRGVLADCGIACDQVFFGHIFPYENKNQDESKIQNSPDLETGLERLRTELQVFRPNCVLLLGEDAYRSACASVHPNEPGRNYVSLAHYRGSIFVSSTLGYRSVATYHPSYIFQSYGDKPVFKLDVMRAVRQSAISYYVPVLRQGNLRPILEDVLAYIRHIESTLSRCTFDIEGYADDIGITMLSLCTTPTDGIVIPFYLDGRNYFTEEDEVQVRFALSRLLANPLIRKEAHNCFYELFVFAWRHHCVINNLHEDTLIKHWEVFPEAAGDPNADDSDTGNKQQTGLGRSLAFCTSIYTEQPYYKGDRLSDDSEVKLRYNLTDSQVTNEIVTATEVILSKQPKPLAHYRFNMSIVPPLNYIMLRGCKFDIQKVQEIANETKQEILSLTKELDDLILPAALTADILTRKRKSDSYSFNVKSTKQKVWLLFTHLNLKPLKRHGKSTNEIVLLHYWSKTQNPLLRLVIRAVRKRTRLSDINKLTPNVDGRIRTSLDPVGTNTGRLSSRESQALELHDGVWTNTGTNLQNVTKPLRVCFIPDTPSYDFWQFDLSGADGWTVGADLAALGHPAMLDDYLHGIKPALVLYYMLQERRAGRDPALVNRLDRSTLKLELQRVKHEVDTLEGKVDNQGRPLDWEYICAKQVQHGTNYGAEADKITEIIFKRSDGAIALSKSDASLYQYYYKLRYNPDARNERIARALRDYGYLEAACGIRRQFFNIRNRRDIDPNTIREASAFEPQANTTWATNKALQCLWYDPENRTSRGGLFIEPLLQIHDALGGQYKSANRDWAGRKLVSWFNNPLVIHGTKILIPADGRWGSDWKNCKNSFTI